MAYGMGWQEAISRVEALALRVLAECLEHGDRPAGIEDLFSVAV